MEYGRLLTHKRIIVKTYTFGRTPYPVIKDALPHKYPMELNKNDMLSLLMSLKYVANATHLDTHVQEWAVSMRQSILETIGIEEV